MLISLNRTELRKFEEEIDSKLAGRNSWAEDVEVELKELIQKFNFEVQFHNTYNKNKPYPNKYKEATANFLAASSEASLEQNKSNFRSNRKATPADSEFSLTFFSSLSSKRADFEAIPPSAMEFTSAPKDLGRRLWNSHSQLKFIDFGIHVNLSKEPASINLNTLEGKLPYLPPEQSEGMNSISLVRQLLGNTVTTVAYERKPSSDLLASSEKKEPISFETSVADEDNVEELDSPRLSF